MNEGVGTVRVRLMSIYERYCMWLEVRGLDPWYVEMKSKMRI